MRSVRRSIVTLLAFVLAVAAMPLALAAPDFSVPGDTDVELATGDGLDPFIAQGDSTALAVWADDRANLTAFDEGETSADLYGFLLDSDGTPVGTVPFAVADGPGAQDKPIAVWNGANWLVVHESYDVSGTGFFQKSLQAVRVSPSGEVLDDQPIRFFGVPPGTSWDVASDGSGWVLVAQGSTATSNIVAIRISAEGVVVDPPTQTVIVGRDFQQTNNLDLEYANGVFVLLFNDSAFSDAITKMVRFDAALNLLDPTPVPLLVPATTELAANDTGFYVVWSEPDGFSYKVVGSRLTSEGVLLDPSGVLVTGGKLPQAFSTTDLTWDGVNWRVTFGFADSLWTTRINEAGVVLDPNGVAVAGPETGQITGNGIGGFYVTWTDFAQNNYDAFVAGVSATNAAGPNHGLSVGVSQQLRADLAVGDAGAMLVYRSSSAESQRVLAQPIDAAGQPLTAEPTVLDVGAGFNSLGSPAVAWNGSVYLVAWVSSGNVVAQRVAADGALVDAGPVLVMADAFGRTDVAALGDVFLVTGREFGFTTQVVLPIAVRVDGTSGAVLDSAPLLIGSNYAGTPAVTVLGGKWFAAWHRNVTHDDPIAETKGTFITADGTVEGEFQVHGFFSTTGGNSVFEVGLASNGTTAAMVQSQELSSGVETDLLVHFIDQSGTVSESTNLTPWRGNQYSPRVTWDGTHFVIAFQDQKNRIAGLPYLDARSDLFAMRVGADGTVIDPAGFVFSAEDVGESYPTVEAAAGVTWMAGSVMQNDSVNANYRIVYDLLGVGGNQWPVAVAEATPSFGDVPLPVAFSSAGSTDPDGTVMAYAWDFGDGATSTDANPSHTFTTPGEYVVTLAVTDDGGATTTQAILVDVTAPNQIPIAAAEAVPSSGAAPLAVVFYASGSYDPDGFVGNVHWTFSDGGEYWGSTAFHTFQTEGVHTATVEVFDSRGGIGTATVTVTVGASNSAPTAVAAATPTSGEAPLDVTFSSAGSADSDGTIAAYDWNFGDGTSSPEANPSHTYTAAGTYAAVLTVTDDGGATGTDSVTVTVTETEPPGDQPPTVTITNPADGDVVSGTVLITTVAADDVGVRRVRVSIDGKFIGVDRGAGVSWDTTTAADGPHEILAVATDTARQTGSDTITVIKGGDAAPTVAITAPSDGATVLGTVSVVTTATDDVGVDQVEVFVDGVSIGMDLGSGVSWDTTAVTDGLHDISATATDTAGQTATHTISVLVANDGGAAGVHVGDLDAVIVPNGSRSSAEVTVIIHDPDEAPVADATVTATWDLGRQTRAAICTTDATGACVLLLSRVPNRSTFLSLTIDGVTHPTSSYQPIDNHDPDGDSDGTTITFSVVAGGFLE